MEETVSRIEKFIASGKPHQHVVINVDKLIKLRRDPALEKIIRDCDLINVDGQPIVWAARVLGKRIKERVTGIDLMQHLIGITAQRGYRIYFLGAREDVIRKVVEHYRAQYPSLKICGWRNGYWSSTEEDKVIRAIKETSPDILFVAISSPKKEKFLSEHLASLGVPFAMGVGGAFDIVAGVAKRAPLWMRKIGLEWFWRFLQEPKRMWKRYFVDDIVFAKLFFIELFKKVTKNHQGRDF